jgi:hypothetical protein
MLRSYCVYTAKSNRPVSEPDIRPQAQDRSGLLFEDLYGEQISLEISKGRKHRREGRMKLPAEDRGELIIAPFLTRREQRFDYQE